VIERQPRPNKARISLGGRALGPGELLEVGGEGLESHVHEEVPALRDLGRVKVRDLAGQFRSPIIDEEVPHSAIATIPEPFSCPNEPPIPGERAGEIEEQSEGLLLVVLRGELDEFREIESLALVPEDERKHLRDGCVAMREAQSEYEGLLKGRGFIGPETGSDEKRCAVVAKPRSNSFVCFLARRRRRFCSVRFPRASCHDSDQIVAVGRFGRPYLKSIFRPIVSRRCSSASALPRASSTG
jgi:hypothetical protein